MNGARGGGLCLPPCRELLQFRSPTKASCAVFLRQVSLPASFEDHASCVRSVTLQQYSNQSLAVNRQSFAWMPLLRHRAANFAFLGSADALPSPPVPSCPVPVLSCFLGVETAVGDPSGEVERLEAAAKAREEAEEEADYRAVERGHVRRDREKVEGKWQTDGEKTPITSKSRPFFYTCTQ